MTNEIKLKITIDNKEAIASIQLTDENIKELYKSFKFGKQEVNGFTTQLSMGFNNAREIIQGVQETLGVLRSVLAKPLQVSADFEQANISFEVLIGNAEEARDVVKQLREFGAKTPLQFTDLQKASQTLLSFGISAKELLPTLKMLGDVSMGDSQKLQSLTLAFAQIQSTGRLMGQDLLQLINAGFNPLKVISEKTGESVASLKKKMSEGGISAKDVADAFRIATGEGGKFHNMLEKMSDTLSGAESNFQDAITTLQASIGNTLSVAVSPFFKGLSQVIGAMNELSPTITGITGAISSLTASYVLLKTMGLTPIISSLFLKKSALEAGISATIKQRIANAGLVASEEAVSVSALGVAGSLRAAGIAAKTFFTSLGPIGWAVIGFTTLVEVIGLFGDKLKDAGDDAEDMQNAFAKHTLKQLEDELKDVKEAVSSTRQALQEARKDYNLYAQQGSSLDTLNQKKAELEQAQQNYNNAVEYENKLTEAIAKKREEIKDSITASYQRLSEKLEVETQKTDTAKQLKRLEITYEHEQQILEEAYKTKIIDHKTYEEKLTQLTQVYQIKRDKIIREGAKKEADGILANIDKQIKELQEKRMFAKSVEEVVKIDRKIKELKSRKEEIELKVKLSLEGKTTELNAESLLPKGLATTFEIPAEIKPVATADDFTELQQMKFASIEDENERERAYLDAQCQADLERYKGVIGAKGILDKYYHQRKRELEKQTAEMQIQSAINALNFVAGAVNQYTAVGKGIAIANAIWSTYQAANKTLASVPYPFNIPLVAAVTAAGIMNVQKIIEAEPPKMPRFAEGGRLPKGQAGFVEGWHNELIAPEKTFVEIFQQELRPKIYSQVAIESQRNEIRELRRALENRPIDVNVSVDNVTARKIWKVGKREMEREFI